MHPEQERRPYSATLSSRYIPPMNFGLVQDNLYRSGQPNDLNFPFLERLNLRTVIWLAVEDPTQKFLNFIDDQGIQFYHLGQPQLSGGNAVGGTTLSASNAIGSGSPYSHYHHHHTNQQQHLNSMNSFAPALSQQGSINSVNMQDPSQSSTLPHSTPSALMNINSSGMAGGGGAGLNIWMNTGGLNGSASPVSAGIVGGGMGMGGMTGMSSTAGGGGAPWDPISEEVVLEALSLLLDVRNYPVMVMCTMGRHRTGTVVGCFRKLQRWSLTSIFEEYRRYAGSKVRILNEQFIELFDTDLVRIPASAKSILGSPTSTTAADSQKPAD